MNAEYSLHKGHNKTEHIVYEVMMLGNNNNSYLEINMFDKNIEHYFGVSLGDSGFGDKLNLFANDIPQEALNNYEKFVSPILRKYNITTEPSFVIVQQTS